MRQYKTSIYTKACFLVNKQRSPGFRFTQQGLFARGGQGVFATPLAKFGDKKATDLLPEGQFKCVARMIASDYEERRA